MTKSNEPTRCDRCHEPVIMQFAKLTSESEPYCSHCGFVFGTSIAPASWVCEDCSEVVLDHGGEERPWCETCKVPMSCLKATASAVHGAGTGFPDLEYGLAFFFSAQESLLCEGGDILTEILAGTNILEASPNG